MQQHAPGTAGFTALNLDMMHSGHSYAAAALLAGVHLVACATGPRPAATHATAASGVLSGVRVDSLAGDALERCAVSPPAQSPRDTVTAVVSWPEVPSLAQVVSTSDRFTAPSGAVARASLAESNFVRLQLSQPRSPAVCDSTAAAVSPQSIGTAAYRLDESAVTDSTVILTPVAGGSIVAVIADRGRDQRDLLDAGADLLVSRSATVVDYAQGGRFSIHPLPFDQTHVLVMSAAQDVGAPAHAAVPPDVASAGRAALARDAVRVDARAAQTLSWISDASSCISAPDAREPQRRTAAARPAGPRRIVYEENDAIGRALAERLVAVANAVRAGSAADEPVARLLAALAGPERPLGGGSFSASPFAAPGAADAVAAAASRATAAGAESASLHAGGEFAYVLRLPMHVASHCESLRLLREAMPWLDVGQIYPLVESRPFLITRPGVPAIAVDQLGRLRLIPRAGAMGNVTLPGSTGGWSTRHPVERSQ